MVNLELECWLTRQRELELRRAAKHGQLVRAAKESSRARTRPVAVTPPPRGGRLREERA